jgi:hypothetical protein
MEDSWLSYFNQHTDLFKGLKPEHQEQYFERTRLVLKLREEKMARETEFIGRIALGYFDKQVVEILTAYGTSRFPQGKFYLSPLSVINRKAIWQLTYPGQDEMDFQREKVFYCLVVALAFDDKLSKDRLEISGAWGGQLFIPPNPLDLIFALSTAFVVNQITNQVYIP